MGWRMGGRFKREETFVYICIIHVVVWQKSTQHCKAVVLQLKKKKEMAKDLLSADEQEKNHKK